MDKIFLNTFNLSHPKIKTGISKRWKWFITKVNISLFITLDLRTFKDVCKKIGEAKCSIMSPFLKKSS